MSNLKRYDFGYFCQCDDDCMCGENECPDGEWVKFDEAVEASSNSLQQLQSKIAALIPAVQACSGYARNGEAIRSVVEKMRQLSVVQ